MEWAEWEVYVGPQSVGDSVDFPPKAPPAPKQSVPEPGEPTALPLTVPGLTHSDLARSLSAPSATVRSWAEKQCTPAVYKGAVIPPYRYDPALKRWFRAG